MSSKIEHKHSIYVRSFSGAKVRSMKDYVKPCVIGENPDHIIIHIGTNDLNCENPDHIIIRIGTNDLNCEKNPERVAKSIVDLAKGIASAKRKVTVSRIIPRNDEWNKKAEEVNQHLKDSVRLLQSITLIIVVLILRNI